MPTFDAVLSQMLFLFLCMLIGFILRKTKVIPESAATVISKVENYVCIPALVISVNQNYCNWATLSSNTVSILYCTGVILLSCIVGFILAPKLSDSPKNTGIFRYSLVFTNFGFMGQAVVQGVLGSEALFSYFIFEFPAAIFLYTIGTAWLTGHKEKFTWKILLNPMYLAMAIGILIGFTGIQFPDFISKTIDGFSACYSPLAMLLTGIVIAQFDIRKLFRQTNIYILTLIRLVLMPLAFYGLCMLFHIPDNITINILIFTAMPLGLYTIIIPAATGGDEMPGASMAVISNLVGLITVPLILCLVI